MTADSSWLTDTLRYFGRDPIQRRLHHVEVAAHVTRRHEVLTLPDERTLFGQMWGDDWQKRAHMRLVYAYQYSLIGTKQSTPVLPKSKLLVGDLDRLLAREAALRSPNVEWIISGDADNSVFVYERSAGADDAMIVALNCTPVPRTNYRVGVREPNTWRELLNTDAVDYDGTGHGNLGGVEAAPVPANDRPLSLNLTLPPLGALFLGRES